MSFLLAVTVAITALAGLTAAAPAAIGGQVTLAAAFSSGAGNRNNANINENGNGRGTDSYTCYSGSAADFPDQSRWVDFDAMWNYTKSAMQTGCGNEGISPQDTNEQIGEIFNAIQTISQNSLVDHRFILSIIIQESIGCVWVGTSHDQDGDPNPGLMQSAGGVSYDPNNSQSSINQMVMDGTQGTASGDGLVQAINMFGKLCSFAELSLFLLMLPCRKHL
jgi:hypothetical protein